jgi:hypothetical protein
MSRFNPRELHARRQASKLKTIAAQNRFGQWSAIIQTLVRPSIPLRSLHFAESPPGRRIRETVTWR